MKPSQSDREADIDKVMKIREKLTESCQKLSAAISEKDTGKVNGLLIEVSAHLSNIAGFCDKYSRTRVNAAQRLLSFSMIDDTGLSYIQLNGILPMIAGFEVNFNKRPFRMMKFSIGNFSFQGEKD